MTRQILILLLIFIFSSAKSQTADFNFSTTTGLFCNPQTVNFIQNCTGNPINYIWNFGNGQTGNSASANITYSNAGTYNVTLTAVYATTAISTTKTVVINPTPTVTLTADKNYLCQPGNVVFTATGSAFITSYEWNFGDGSPVVTTGSNSVNYNYTGYNIFNTTVKAITANGCTASAVYQVNVAPFPINAAVTPPDGCIPMNSVLNATVNLPAGDAAQSFVWNFGDGSPNSTTATGSINHLYNTTNTINTASVSITSVQGCTNQFNFPPFAYGTPPFATVSQTVASRDTFCGSENIQFYAKATNANLYSWDFGDGTTASTPDTLISHKYRTLGNKRVIVTPYFNGCAGLKDTLNIFIEGVIANFTFSNTCGNKNTYAFSNLSLGNISHFEWLFSDVPLFADSVNYNTSHSFPVSGTYSARLNLVDSITGCTDNYTVFVYTATPSVSGISSPVCKDSLITYRVSNTYPPGPVFSYEFHVNGNIVNNANDSVLAYFPATAGNFTDYVVIKDIYNGTCNDTLYLPAATRVRGPVIDFTVSSGLCADTSVIIINNSYPFFAGDNIVTWQWTFDDSKTDSVKDPLSHKYNVAGNYSIILTATDINGCSQKLKKQALIYSLPAISVFPKTDTICRNDTAVLKAFTADSLLWSPAVNIDCTSCDTVKVYPTTTTQYIAQAFNTYGCKTYDTSLVKVFAPISLQVFPADTLVCAGQPVPYNLSADGIINWSPPTYLSNTTIKNPVAVADTTITYSVTVTDSVGCFTDTAFATIRIRPKPVVDAGPDLVLPYNTAFTITPLYSSDITTYLWSPPGNLNCINCANPAGIALQKQSYQVEVTNNNGCKATDNINVLVNCLQSNLLMPTAFTPNRDGLNDYFYPITRGYGKVKAFIIFNRLGNKVFERRNFDPNIPTLGWDGRIKDYKYGTSETFTWFMEATCDSGEMMSSKGTVVLIR